MNGAGVRVEVIELDDSGFRQVSEGSRVTARLSERSAEVQEAIREASNIAQDSLQNLPERPGWRVSGLEVTFGLTLAVEAGVIVSKASGEASFEVTLSIERTG